MMNVRLKLRESSKLIVPKGPSFGWSRTIKSDIDGTHIQLKAPRHRPRYSNDYPSLPERQYRSSDYSDGELYFRSMYGDQEAAEGRKDHFDRLKFLYQSWAFYGPWFTGTVAELSLSIDFIRVRNYPEDMSLFHPRALEQVVGDLLTFRYGHHLDFTRDDIQEFKGPVNWQPLSHLPVNAVRLEVVPEEFAAHRTISHYVFFPITDKVMAHFIFKPSRFLGLPRSELDKMVNAQPMYELMDNIINSIELELSPEARSQQAKALQGLEDTSLVKHYPPLKWDKHIDTGQKPVQELPGNSATA